MPTSACELEPDRPETLPGNRESERGSLSLDPSGSLATQQVGEMVAAWRRGERPLAEEFLERHPELGEDAAIRLVYEEVCLRQEAGLAVDYEEILGRFPNWRAELEPLLDCQKIFETNLPAPALPHEGEVLAGFRLVRELGRGAAGRVFLAVQPSLADRPVVLKITSRGRGEHLALARLQHMNIVPLYSEHVLQARDLQILCMPFLGGATLGQVLELIRDEPPSARSGKGLLSALDQIEARLPFTPHAAEPLRNFIARCSYVEAICAIGACLADGLQYAHDRDLLHMDLKPSNVLLASDGQPMLLDFHLARGPIARGAAPPDWAGGTPAYMSPEQWEVITAIRGRHPVPSAVDRRADIYSLGALLYEALGGPTAKSPGTPLPPLEHINPCVSPGLSDIIARCLYHDAALRYDNAASLASDLRRHLSNLPLLGVSNRSLTERWRKWRRRRPVALSRTLVILLVAGSALLAAGTLALAYRQRLRDVDSVLTAGRTSLAQHQFVAAAGTLERGLSLSNNLPGAGRRRADLAHALASAQRGARLDELHKLAQIVRFRYGLALPPPEEAQSLLRLGRSIWDGRDRLIQPLDRTEGPALDERTRMDLLDMVVLWADLRLRLAAADQVASARRDALRILTEAKALLGNCPSLERTRAACARRSGSRTPPPLSPWRQARPRNISILANRTSDPETSHPPHVSFARAWRCAPRISGSTSTTDCALIASVGLKKP